MKRYRFAEITMISMALLMLMVPHMTTATETVLSFSGTDSYVDLGMPSVLQIPSDGPFTVEGWMYLNSLDTRDMLYSKNNGRNANGYSFLLGLYDTGDMGIYSPASNWVKCNPESNLDTARWYHLAFSYDGTNVSFFLDGEAYGTKPFSFVNVVANTVKLGGYYSGADCNGMKSDVRVWDHARSQQQIVDNRVFRLFGDEEGLLGYWPLNDGSGTVALDQTSNASTGTVVNATWTETEDLELLPAGSPFFPTDAFSMADIETGNPDYTVSNVVDVTDFPIPEGYDRYQVTASGEASSINTNDWVSTNTLPAQLSLGELNGPTNMILYAWFTNNSESVTLQRGPGEITFVTDVSDSVVDFLAPASYVSLSNPESLQLTANHPLTVEGWVRFKSFGSEIGLFCKNNAARGSPYSYLFGVRGSGTELGGYTGHAGSPATTWVDLSLPTALQTERWYHLAFSFDGTNLSGYVDGEKIGEAGYSFGNYTAHTITIGSYKDATDPNALRSDVRFWDHARSTVDIAQYRDRRLSGMEPGLLGYWPLNDWSATTATDRSANTNHGAIVNAMSTFSEGFSLDAPPEGFVLASAFSLADVENANARFTNSNTVDVTTFPLPTGYDLYQVTESADPAAIASGGWLSTGAPPTQLTFTQPAGDTNIILYAWFTNSMTNATLLRGEGSIYYTEVLPVPNVRPTLTREMQGSTVVITASDIDLASTGGEANGFVLDVESRAALAATPGHDQTLGEPYVTLDAEGDYPLLLWLKNEAGNAITSVATCTVSVVSYSGSNTWTGLGASDLWSDGANWGAGVPVPGQEVVVLSGALRLTAATAQLGSLVLGADATLTFEGWESTLQADEITVAGTVTHAAQTVTEPDSETGEWVPQHRVWLRGSNLTVTASASIDVDYKGYPTGAGPGAPTEGGGYDGSGGGGYGGHGGSGFGGGACGPAYGDFADPWQPGSGSKQYLTVQNGSGGGAIRVEMSGRITIDGSLSARGQSGAGTHQPAGSGGGIALYCDTFQGDANGLIRVDGGRGNYYGGNGGGGRIALHYNPASQAMLANPRPPVQFSAHAWRTSQNGYEFTLKGQMGTLYLTDTSLLAETPTADTLLDGQRFWYTRLYAGNAFTNWSPASLTVSNCVIGFPQGFELHVAEDLVLAGPRAPLVGDSAIGAGLVLYAADTNRLYGAQLRVGRDLTLGAKAWLYPHTEGYSAAVVGMRVGRDFTVAASGGIDADEKGYMPQSGNANGPGAGAHGDSGGSYGGLGGGSAVGQTYGQAALPLEPGSPGGWRSYGSFTPSGKGGGAIHMLAGGKLMIDGLLTANGGRGWYFNGPAGSGGAIFLSGMKVSGSGTLRANGGAGQSSRGPGGGGRIAIWLHMPLGIVEKRIAERNVVELVRSADYSTFTGELQADVTTSVLTHQPEEGTTGFYTIPGTLVILR